MNKHPDIPSIADKFRIEGECISALLHGSGHIHDTYRVTVRRGNRDIPFLMQRINHLVFTDPPGVMENMVRVTEHLRGKLETQGMAADEVSRRVLRVIPTNDGAAYFRDGDGNFWRVLDFIDGAHTFDVVESESQLFQAARAFGLFLAMLHDFPPPPLHETIPGFHDGEKRLAAFQKALEADVHNRAATAKSEIDFVLANVSIFDVFPRLMRQGALPVRVTHNDTKINNVLVDDVTGEGICVIDLDTVMPGVSPYDFGDLGRTTLSPTDEDERDLSKIGVEMPRFEAILKGFLVGAGTTLSPTERDYLVFGIKMMTQIIGLRFLTDYLLGDIYFKVHRPAHNLDRCRTQFKLVQSITEHEEEMNDLAVSQP
jgi:aminoglycoside phosphotransferase (APT) family kinase protein